MEKRKDTSSLLAITAPFEGVVVERSAVQGELAPREKVLFAVARIDKMWAFLDIYENHIPRIRKKQPVLFQVEGLSETFGGPITRISTSLDAQTRTLQVRAEVANPKGLLKHNMFGRARILIHQKERVVVVPKEAVQWEGCCNVVFLKRSDTLFEPRKVRLGYEGGDFYEVLEGLRGGEMVVTKGSFLLKTEILKGSIGAGCCETEAPKK